MRIMDGSDLVLQGTRPGSRQDSSIRPASACSNLNETSRQGQRTYADRLFGSQAPHITAGTGTNTPSGPTTGKHVARSDKGKPKKAKHMPSYVDESLFGPKLVDPGWAAPWESKSKMTGTMGTHLMFDGQLDGQNRSLATESSPAYRPASREAYTDRPPSGRQSAHSMRPHTASSTRPPTAQAKAKKTTYKHTPSYVDETLFGGDLQGVNYPTSWPGKTIPKASLGPSNYRSNEGNSYTQTTVATRGTSTRPPGQYSQSHAGRASPKKHNPSYVDETLFGAKPMEAGWPAPWEERQQRKQVPLAFDGIEHKLTIHHKGMETVKPRNRVIPPSMRRSSSASSKGKAVRPAWR